MVADVSEGFRLGKNFKTNHGSSQVFVHDQGNVTNVQLACLQDEYQDETALISFKVNTSEWESIQE